MTRFLTCSKTPPSYSENSAVIWDMAKGSLQNCFLDKVGHLAQPADPPPPRKLGRQKKKKKFNLYLAF